VEGRRFGVWLRSREGGKSRKGRSKAFRGERLPRRFVGTCKVPLLALRVPFVFLAFRGRRGVVPVPCVG
jgi:hypothetical protein